MSSHKQPQIIAIDDDPFILNLLKRLINGLDYSNFEAFENPQDALAFYDRIDAPDIIFLDINMPEIDGIQFVRLMKNRAYDGHLIFISGEDELMLQTLTKLANLHQLKVLGSIQKPLSSFHVDELLNAWQVRMQQMPTKRNVMQTSNAISLSRLNQALLNGEFINHYQPKVCMKTGKWIGVEALVRWKNPEFAGLIFPDQFIPQLENYGLIQQLTENVLDRVVQDICDIHGIGEEISCAVNVSMDDISDVGFTDFILFKLRNSCLSPKWIQLEVTESRLAQNLTNILDVLARLRLHRFKLSIDDFGTGHSTLLQLLDMPFDQLKIDKAFVHKAFADARRDAILRTTLMLSQQLNLEVVAEGIETIEDWRYLQTKGCDVAQGYFIGRPMPLEKLHDWYQDWQVRIQNESLMTPSFDGGNHQR